MSPSFFPSSSKLRDKLEGINRSLVRTSYYDHKYHKDHVRTKRPGFKVAQSLFTQAGMPLLDVEVPLIELNRHC
jgi:LmbE family N-acetylglucosaminyl deacetylase